MADVGEKLLLIIPSFAIAAVMAYIAWAGATERLSRNAAVGIRTESTTKSDIAWYAAHKAAVPFGAGASMSFAVAGVAASFASTETSQIVVLLSGYAIAFAQMGVGLSVAVKAANSADSDD